MSTVLIVLIVLLLLGEGGGWYYGGPYVGGGLGFAHRAHPDRLGLDGTSLSRRRPSGAVTARGQEEDRRRSREAAAAFDRRTPTVTSHTCTLADNTGRLASGAVVPQVPHDGRALGSSGQFQTVADS